MKKLILLFVAIVFSLTQMLAQESTFVKGDKVLNLGIGFGGRYTGSGMTTSVPPLSASFEVGVKDGVLEKGSIGVGGMLAYSSHKWEYSGWGWKYTSIVIGARGSFHYPLVDKLDTYTGLLIGYDISTSTEIWNCHQVMIIIHHTEVLLMHGLSEQDIISVMHLLPLPS